MTYATLADLTARAGEAELKQIADRDRDGEIDTEVVDAALADASSMIDGYVATKYDIPLATVPDLVRTWAVCIARYTLHRNGPPEHVTDDYKAAIAALKDVSRGLIALPLPSGGSEPTKSGSIQASHAPEVFTETKLRGWTC